MMFTAAHELTHFIKDWSPVKFRKLADLLVKRYAEQGVSVRDLIDNQIAKAEKNGRTIDRDTAFEEVVADSMETMLTQGDAASFMAQLKQQDKTLWEKVRDWFKNLAEKLRGVVDAYQGYTPDSPEGRLVAQMEDFIGVLQEAYSEALVDASENYRANDGKKNTTQEGGVKYQARPTDKDTVHIKEMIKAASNDLNAMDPVADVSTVDLTKMNTNQRYKWAVSILKATGYKIDRQNFGVIEFSEKQINTGMNYLNDPGEFAAFAALPRVLKRGKIIHDDNNHKFRKFGTVIIAAPVTINGVRGNMGVAIQKTTSTHYHTHRILMPDGSAFEFKINAAPTPSGDLANNAHRATTISTASNDKVTQQKPGVNPKSMEKRSDREYLAAVERGDMATAQRMVDEAAKRWGAFLNNAEANEVFKQSGEVRIFYHGTNTGDFTVFDKSLLGNSSGDLGWFGKGFYFAFSSQEAASYGGRVINAYLKMSKPYDYSQLYKFKGSENVSSRYSRFAWLYNVVDQFPDIVNGQKVYAYPNDAEDGSVVSWKQLAKWMDRIERDVKFSVEQVETPYGETAWELRADPKQESFTNADGETFTWTEYGMRQQFTTEEEAKAPINQIGAYLANVMGVETIPRRSIEKIDFSGAVQRAGYDGIIQSPSGDEAVVFDPSQIKSSDPVTYGDDGKVIPLSERFDTTKADIRYSDRDPTAAATAQELEKQGKALEADVENLVEMLRLQGDVTRKDSGILSAARYLSTYHGVIGSKQDPALNKELAGLLKDFYGYLDTEKDLSWGQIAEKAKPVTEWIFKHTEAGRQRSEYARNIQ